MRASEIPKSVPFAQQSIGTRNSADMRGRSSLSGAAEERVRSHSTCTLDSAPTNGSRATSTERLHISSTSGEPLSADGCCAGMIRSKGLYVDAHQLVRDRSTALDIYKGVLVVLMHSSNTMVFLGTKTLRTDSFTARMICNMASSQCFIGFMMAFGYSSYRQYLREWPDPPKDLHRVRMRVLRAIACPVIGAWICNFAWCFLSTKNDRPPTWRLALDVFTFASVFGNGPDFLLGFSINLALVYFLWRPINSFLDGVQPGTSRVEVLYPHIRRDAAALGVVLSPLLVTLVALPDCTGNMRWAQWFFVCEKRDLDTPTLPALPHLLDFGIGVLVASAWDRFIAHLKPVGQGGPSGGLHLLPMAEAGHWASVLFSAAVVSVLLFVPLGQVWLSADLVQAHVQTPVGQLVRGFSGGPSALWMLATLWPAAVLGVLSLLLVILRGGPIGYILKWPLALLEHFGANVLYYLIVVDLFLAGMSGGIDQSQRGLDAPSCLLCTTLVLVFCRFLHYAAQASRK